MDIFKRLPRTAEIDGLLASLDTEGLDALLAVTERVLPSILEKANRRKPFPPITENDVIGDIRLRLVEERNRRRFADALKAARPA